MKPAFANSTVRLIISSIIVSVISFSSLSLWACPDLSGSYEFISPSPSRLTITQTGCELIEMTISRPPYADNFTISYRTDGKTYEDAYYAATDKKLNVAWTTPGLASEDTLNFHRAEFIGDALLVKQFQGSQKECTAIAATTSLAPYTFSAMNNCFMTADNFMIDPLDPTGRTLIKVQIGYFRDGKGFSSDETHGLKAASR